MAFVDLHSHILFGVDDGACSLEEMFSMVDASYADGVRVLCLTPHFDLSAFGDNRIEATDAYRQLRNYVKQAYPKMGLYLANELRYSRDCLSWLDQGLCRTIDGSRYVLVDFSTHEKKRVIIDGLWRILGGGYIPILAHPERYRDFGFSLGELKEFHQNGVLLQMDAQSILGGFGKVVKMRSQLMLKEGLVDFIGSDAHDCCSRSPQISGAFDLIARKHGQGYADAICRTNALRLLKKIKSDKELG